jgi:hypothetical protein
VKVPELEPFDDITRGLGLVCLLPRCDEKAEYFAWVDERQKVPICAEHAEHIRIATEALLDPSDPRAPKYWMFETSGVLQPAVEAFLRNQPMSPRQLGAMRAYLRQWIQSPVWRGEELAKLRKDVETIQTREDIQAWLDAAVAQGYDPL